MRIRKPFKKRGTTGPVFWLVALGLLASPLAVAGFAGYYLFLKDAEKPQVAIAPEADAASLKRPFTVTAADDQSGIRSLTVTVAQGQRRVDVLRKTFDPPRDHISERFTLESSELRGGAFEMQVAAYDGSHANLGAGNAARLSKRMLLDPVPPTVKALTPAHYMRQGGAGLVVYEVNKDVARSGVLVGDRFYPGYKQKSGQFACLFPYPSDLEPEAYKPRLFVEDAAGNEKTGFFVNMAIKRRFREERVEITDEFLAARLPAFAGLFPQERDPIERFKKLQTELRRQNTDFIASLAAKSGPEPLWDGGFVYLPRSVVRGSFGADRVYVSKGQEIGRERSDGIGLASLPGATVPAANSGNVVFAGPLGVYGNTVVIDHGLGLSTVYANLSSVAVAAGDAVKKGDAVGATGTTGLTPGDQVHFAVYLAGQPVIPIEWWDAHWIEDNVTMKLRRFAAETPQQ
jgi:murein DD-endopeptidase MepM/ murein hydrolase activator NlpD